MDIIPVSGYAICFGPLAIVILGFIAYATLTDANARRTYLRRTDMRPESERPPYTVAPLKKNLNAQTPSGLPVSVTPTAVVPDDLKRIEGIGPKMQSVLNKAGLYTFADVAAKSADELRAVLSAAGVTGINDPTTWPQQAALAARGAWDDLAALQNNLKGGRRTA